MNELLGKEGYWSMTRYRDEKYVEALEDKVKELTLRLSRTTEGAQAKALRAGGDARGSAASAVQTEEMYRRARTEVAAEAGAGYGRVSLEALYLLPAEFTNAYQRLFLRALKESPGKVGEANPPVKTKAKRGQTKVVGVWDEETQTYVKGQVKEVELALDRDPSRGGGAARSSGRRHRDHWTIADERAFRLKKTVDDQLRELADWVTQSLASRWSEEANPGLRSLGIEGKLEINSRAAGQNGRLQPHEDDLSTGKGENLGALQCRSCSRFLKSTWNHCPHCGTAAA